MEIYSPNPALITWTVLCFAHIILAYTGARKLLRLDIDPFVKFIWLLAIFFIPFAGVATFFVLRNNKKQAE